MLKHVGPVPPEWEPHIDSTSFWRRGIPPLAWSRTPADQLLVHGTGIWAELKPVSTNNLIFATDGSGGPASKEPRLRQVTFGIAALDASRPHAVLGTLFGTVPGRQTVPRAEAFGLLKLLEMTEGPVKSCLDAKAVHKRWKKLKDITQLSANLDIWGPLARQKAQRADVELHWTRSHLSESEHVRLFPDEQWMYPANHAADVAASSFATQVAVDLHLSDKQKAIE